MDGHEQFNFVEWGVEKSLVWPNKHESDFLGIPL